MSAHLSAEALSVIDKVQKLLALAGNNPNENEAAAASAKAMELLAAYNLDMAIVGKTAKGSQRSDNKLKGGLYGWQRDLWKASCELNFCMYWSIKGLAKGSTYEHRILGREENVIGARIMAEYLQQTIERITQDYAKARGYHCFERAMIAYREGMSDRLVTRLKMLREEQKAADRAKEEELRKRGSSAGTGIVLASVIQSEEDANWDHAYGLKPGTTAQRRADQAARQAAAQAAYEEERRKQEEWQRNNPEEAARLAGEAAKARYDAEMKRVNDEMKKAKRRKAPVPQYRKATAQEQRANMSTFAEGKRCADSVSLNRQVGDGKKDRLS